jgi:hypothetical protein
MFRGLDIMPPAVTKLKRPVTSYLRENVYYTFSGFFFAPTLLDTAYPKGALNYWKSSFCHN